MSESFVSTRDRIIATAIDIISDSGLGQLNTKTVSQKANISEPLLYKFYGDMDELLVDVLNYYFKFDEQIRKTYLAREGSFIDKIKSYFENYAIYYDNYPALANVFLHYEEFLHNPAVREILITGVMKRKMFLKGLIQSACESDEIKEGNDPEMLADTLMGFIIISSMKRRLEIQNNAIRKDISAFINKIFDDIAK